MSRIGAIAHAASKAIPAAHVEILNFMFPPYGIAVKAEGIEMPICSLCTVADAGMQPKEQTESVDTPYSPPPQ